MIVTAIVVYAFLFNGVTLPWYAFVGAALFDWGMAELVFPQQKCQGCSDKLG